MARELYGRPSAKDDWQNVECVVCGAKLRAGHRGNAARSAHARKHVREGKATEKLERAGLGRSVYHVKE